MPEETKTTTKKYGEKERAKRNVRINVGVKKYRKMSNEKDIIQQESKITLIYAVVKRHTRSFELCFFFSLFLLHIVNIQSFIVFRIHDFLRFGHLVFSIKFYEIVGK